MVQFAFSVGQASTLRSAATGPREPARHKCSVPFGTAHGLRTPPHPVPLPIRWGEGGLQPGEYVRHIQLGGGVELRPRQRV